jgi:hypothetical protein
MRGDSAVEIGIHVENTGNRADPTENAVLFGNNGSRSALIGVDAGIAGGIARGPIFLQRIFDDAGDASAIPVHDSSCVVRRWSSAKT